METQSARQILTEENGGIVEFSLLSSVISGCFCSIPLRRPGKRRDLNYRQKLSTPVNRGFGLFAKCSEFRRACSTLSTIADGGYRLCVSGLCPQSRSGAERRRFDRPRGRFDR